MILKLDQKKQKVDYPKDTEQIHKMFELFEIDGEDIAKLQEKVNKLEN